MTLIDIVQSLGTHQYLALAILFAAYARRLTAPDSKCPVNLSPAWQPVASAFVGAVYGGLVARAGGMAVGLAVLHVVISAGAMGIADMILVAAFVVPAKAPRWARLLAFLVDDLTGKGDGSGGTGGGGSSTAATLAPPPLPRTIPAPPIQSRLGLRLLVLIAFGAAVGLLGCISSVPLKPASPDTAAQVSSCQSIASTHNDIVVGDFVIGGVTTGFAGAGAFVHDTNAKDVLAITAAATAAVGIVGAGLTGYTAGEFTNGNCSAYVGPLPASPVGKSDPGGQ